MVVQGPRFRVQGPRFRVQGPRFRVQGPRFRVQGPRFRVPGPRFINYKSFLKALDSWGLNSSVTGAGARRGRWVKNAVGLRRFETGIRGFARQ